jgi:hypothetical protein
MNRGPSWENVSDGEGEGVLAGDMIWGTPAAGRAACAVGAGGGEAGGGAAGACCGAGAAAGGCAVWGKLGIGMTLVRSTGWGSGACGCGAGGWG